MDDRAVEDQRVVESVLGGDQRAFASLVTGYQRMVASVAWRYGVGNEEIEDLVSEVFMKVYRNLHRYRPEHPFSTWLYRLAANHVLDHGRRRRKESGRSEMPTHLEDPTPGPGQSFESKERGKLVRTAMESVPPRYREALFLIYVEGMKVEEAARTLGLPQGTIKSRLMRGREAMRKILIRRNPELFGDEYALP